MISKRFLQLCFVLPLIIACGQTIHTGNQSFPQEGITVTPVTPVLTFPTVLEPTPGEYIKIVILPFADYSQVNGYDLSRSAYWRRNVLILEALQDQFYRFGFMAPMMDDTIAYLFSNNIIVAVNQTQTTNASNMYFSEATRNLFYTYDSLVTTVGKDAIKKAFFSNLAKNQSISKASYSADQNVQNSFANNIIPLDLYNIQSLGNYFNADYIVRGRIIEYGIEDADSLNPLQTGILPFAFKFGTRTLFGFSKSDCYEALNGFAIGAALGQIGANNIPLITQGMTYNNSAYAAQALNSFLWAGIGGTVALMASEGGRVPRTYVQIRLVVQSARTGEIVWYNRVEVDATPRSVYGEKKPRTLYAAAIQQAAKSLVENFVITRVTGKRSSSANSPEPLNYSSPDVPKSPVPPIE